MGLEKDQQRRDAKPLHGLEIEETRVGTGAIAHRGDRVTMWYSGFLTEAMLFRRT
jgi:FKBP-type peptidyl-prolyl cis-trans isomerase